MFVDLFFFFLNGFLSLLCYFVEQNHVIDPDTLEWMRTMMQKNAASLKTNMTKARMARLMPSNSESHFFGQSPDSKEASKRESTVSSSVSSKKHARTRRLTASSTTGNQSESATTAGQNAGDDSDKRSRAPSLASNSESVKTSSPDIDSASVMSMKSSSGSVLRSTSKRRNHSHSPSPSNGAKIVADATARTRAHTEIGASINSKPNKRSSESCLAKQNKGLMVKTDVEGIMEKEQKREKQREEYEKKRKSVKEDLSVRVKPVAETEGTKKGDDEKRKKDEPFAIPDTCETPIVTSATAKEAPSSGMQESDVSSMTNSSKHHHKHHHSKADLHSHRHRDQKGKKVDGDKNASATTPNLSDKEDSSDKGAK